MSDLVSIIMPVYNSGQYLEESVNSITAQTFKNWELMIIDDCSTDNSRQIAEKLARSDSRIKTIFKEKNSGSADSRNTGIRQAGGRYIAFLDSDDLWDSIFLQTQISFMQQHQAAFSFCAYRIINENGAEILKPNRVSLDTVSYRQNLMYNRVGHLTAIYDTSVLGKMYFDPGLKSLRDDYALWLDILKKIPCAHANRQVLASYRVREGAATANKQKLILPHYRMLRNREKLSFFAAWFYTAVWALLGFKKYYLNKFG